MTLPAKASRSGPAVKSRSGRVPIAVKYRAATLLHLGLGKQIGRQRLGDGHDQQRRDGDNDECDRRSRAEIVHREAFLPDLERKQRRGRARTASSHRIDDVVGREGSQRVVDKQNDDDRLDVRKDDVDEALRPPWRRRFRPPR